MFPPEMSPTEWNLPHSVRHQYKPPRTVSGDEGAEVNKT